MAPAALVSGQPGAATLLFLHGVGGDGRSFGNQLAHFGQTHYCLAWHMPGYADSKMINPYDWPGLGNALVELLDAHQIETATVVGHSIGGMVLQQALAQAPERINAAVLSATSPAFGNRGGRFQDTFLRARLGPLDRGNRLADLAPDIVDSLLGESPHGDARDAAIACMASVPEATYRAAMTAITQFDARATLAAIRCPCLLIAGEHDDNAPRDMMARMATHIPSARFAVIARAGHLSYMEQPDAFNQLLSQFLQARDA